VAFLKNGRRAKARVVAAVASFTDSVQMASMSPRIAEMADAVKPLFYG
jgi:hypothetical protein